MCRNWWRWCLPGLNSVNVLAEVQLAHNAEDGIVHIWLTHEAAFAVSQAVALPRPVESPPAAVTQLSPHQGSAGPAIDAAPCVDQCPAAKRPCSLEPGATDPRSLTNRGGRPQTVRTGKRGRPRLLKPKTAQTVPPHRQQCSPHIPALQQEQQDLQPASPPVLSRQHSTAGWAADWCWAHGCSQPCS